MAARFNSWDTNSNTNAYNLPVSNHPTAQPYNPSQAWVQPGATHSANNTTHVRHVEQPLVQTNKPSASQTQPEKNSIQTDRDLEQRKKERDRRERERKERERRKQKEIEQKNKSEAKKSYISSNNDSVNLLKKDSEFLCKLQFRNTLPDVPFDPKLLALPLDNMRYIKYSTTFLEQNYKFSLFTEPDLGVSVNLIDPEAFRVPVSRPVLESADGVLIDAPLAPSVKGRPRSRVGEARPTVSWLRKTEYLATDENLPRFKGKGIETRPGWKHRDEKQETLGAKIKAIGDTFEFTKKPPVHPTNSSLKPVEILPVLPDFELWPTRYIEAVYKGDPLYGLPQFEGTDDFSQDQVRAQAILRGCGNNVVAFLAPLHDTTARKRKREGNEEEEYEQLRTFRFELDQNTEHKDDFFFVFAHDAVFYNALETRLKLNKSKGKEEREQPKPASVTIVRTDMSEETVAERELRYQQLLHTKEVNNFVD